MLAVPGGSCALFLRLDAREELCVTRLVVLPERLLDGTDMCTLCGGEDLYELSL